MNSAVRFTNVCAGYHDQEILHGLSFDLVEGSMTGVIGPNGAGKTTLLRTMTGRVKPSSGSVELSGQALADIGHRTRARLIGVVPQSIELPMAFTVREVVMMGRTPQLSQWHGPTKEDHNAVERAMAFADVSDYREHPFTELSGGEKQRVVIAMVLAQSPRCILLDEATSHLDINHRLEIMQIVERMNEEHGTTVVMISHDLNLAGEFCSRLMLLDHGRIVADGSPADVLVREQLQRVYHCNVDVQKNAASGSVTVTPARRVVTEHSGRGLHVHVIAGGGSGEAVLRRLTIAEYRVTCGVLNEGDTDDVTARALGATVIAEEPFSAISDTPLAEAIQSGERADAVVLCDVPFGSGNLVNLEIAHAAQQVGKPVLVQRGISERDYTDGKATARVAALLAAGATEFDSVTDLFGLLPGA